MMLSRAIKGLKQAGMWEEHADYCLDHISILIGTSSLEFLTRLTSPSEDLALPVITGW